MKILIQMGNKGDSIIDHSISPLARVKDVSQIMLVARKPGPPIAKVRYHCPPGLLRKVPVLAAISEFFILTTLAVIKNPRIIAGYLLFPHGLFAFLAAKITGKPVIASLIAGPVELYSAGSPPDYNPAEEIGIYGKIMLAVLKHTDAIITKGTVTQRFLTERGVPADKIFPLIPCPNTSRFYPTAADKEYDMIFVGRLTRVKNVSTVLAATAEVKKESPAIRLCIVGEGHCRTRLEEEARRLGIEHNVIFAGFQRDIPAWLNRSRILILASQREGFPNVYLEALFCSVSAVVSDCGDITDIAKDGYNAFVIKDCNDHIAFASTIVKLLKDEELYKQMVKNAGSTAQALKPDDNTATWEKIIKKVTALEG